VGTITTGDGTEIFYKDWGSGQPIVFSHGWPLSGDDWDTQMMFFLLHGYRVIAHDRRGHGRSLAEKLDPGPKLDGAAPGLDHAALCRALHPNGSWTSDTCWTTSATSSTSFTHTSRPGPAAAR
jgi:non-heme chloroperoxidase